MNLRVSYQWLKEYVDLSLPVDALAARISLSGPGVERLYPQDLGYDHMVVGRIESIEPHPNADKLRIARVHVGKRSVSIVCGGSNLVSEQWVAVALPGAQVRWHGEGDLITLEQTTIRGEASEGMICAAEEIGLGEAFPSRGDREILDLGQHLDESRLTPGQPLAEALDLAGDVLMDAEITTNRPDAMGMVGFARETAAIIERPFTWKPAPAIHPPSHPSSDLSADVTASDVCTRFMAVRIDGVRVGPSPWYIRRRLLAAGVRPINGPVDITNYVLLELGQPMHVYDADAVVGDTFFVRYAKKGESFDALNGKTYLLDPSMVIVADARGPIDLIGIMGGAGSSVQEATTSVIFEAATMQGRSIRKATRALNLYSDAQNVFEKNLSSESPPYALARAVQLCTELFGGTVSSPVVDVRKEETDVSKTFSVSIQEIRRVMGLDLHEENVKSVLERLGFGVKEKKGVYIATVPWWRDHDIESGRDLIEEVARVYGYENFPPIFPPAGAPREMTSELAFEERIRDVMHASGWTEVYTYSFISATLAERAEYDPSAMIRVQNPLSEEFVYMRTSLLPSLLQTIAENSDRATDIHAFEIGNTYLPTHGTKEPALPDETPMLGIACTHPDHAFRVAKGALESVYEELGIRDIIWKTFVEHPFWHPGRSAQAFSGETFLGTVGEISPLIQERFGIQTRVAMAEIPLRQVFSGATVVKTYQPIPTFPDAKRDVSVLVSRDIQVQDLISTMKNATPLVREVEWFDTYRGKGIAEDKKSVAFHLTFRSEDHTLETQEVDELMQTITTALEHAAAAVVRTG